MIPTDPGWQAVGIAALVVLAFLGLSLRARARAARTLDRVAHQMSALHRRVETLSDGQERLAGGLHQVSEAQAQSQGAMLQVMEHRLSDVQAQMAETLTGSATRTSHALGALRERLATIDAAQENLERLSGDMLGLQDILSNKQARGAFGEIQLHDIVAQALPAGSFSMQAVLSNGRRADCLVHLPDPPGPIVIDSKFPLEAYEALRRAETPEQERAARAAFRSAVRGHMRAIAERYVLQGETADGALMFLPSEAVYAELHGQFPALVREGFEMRVWTVSPTTCMATLTTLRAVLKDARLRAQSGAIRRELSLLARDMERLGGRVAALDRHFGQASRDIAAIRTSADKAAKRARRLDNFDFEDLSDPEDPAPMRIRPPRV